jgi:hypothetical protein
LEVEARKGAASGALRDQQLYSVFYRDAVEDIAAFISALPSE